MGPGQDSSDESDNEAVVLDVPDILGKEFSFLFRLVPGASQSPNAVRDSLYSGKYDDGPAYSCPHHALL